MSDCGGRRRSSAWAFCWVLALSLLLFGCNKGRRIIDEAKKLHDDGNVDGAIAKLERVATEAPGTPEVATAKNLAVEWLLESAARHPKDAFAARGAALVAARQWDPANARTAVAICELARDEGGFGAMRACIEKEEGQRPDDGRFKASKDELSAHDALIAAARERKKLLFSTEVEDWRTLTTKFASTPEAARATKKLQRNESLCADRKLFAGPLVMHASWMADVVPKIRALRSLSAKLGQIDIVQAESAIWAKTFRALERRVEAHPTKPGEEPIRAWLAGRYADAAGFHELYAADLAKGAIAEKMTMVVLVDDFIKRRTFTDLAAMKGNVDEPCTKLGVDSVSLGADDVATGFQMRKSFCSDRLVDPKGAAACYGTALTKRAKLEGTVMARVFVRIDGTLGAVEDAGSDLDDESITSCVLDSLRKRECESPTGGEASYLITCALSKQQAQCSYDPIVLGVRASASSAAAPGATSDDGGIADEREDAGPSVADEGKPNDGTDPKRPVLAPADKNFVDKRGGWGWSDRCWVSLKASKWGFAKAECDEGMKLDPASPQPRASLLYNQGLIAKAAGDNAGARALFTQSLALREHPEVRAALDALP